MNFAAPSWDLFTILFVIITIGYGFMMQRERIIVTMVAAYVGIAFSELFWKNVAGFFQGDSPLFGKYFIHGNFSPTQIHIAIFLGTLLIVATKAGLDVERGEGWLSPLELLVISGLTGALIVATVVGYLPADVQHTLAAQSRFVAYLINHHSLVVLAPVAALAALGFRQPRGNR